jgi:glyoxylase-like metal-dependent hydrolase (beta-lactamase superfamily II)
MMKLVWQRSIKLLLAIAISIVSPNLISFDRRSAFALDKPGANQTSDNTTITVHTYASPRMDPVNLYWAETNSGIVIVDTGRFLSQAQYALEAIRSQSDKPIIGILITHPHTDHYGGLPVFAEAAIENVPIYASQITYDDIKTDGQGFIQLRNNLHGNDFPDRDEIPLPNQIVKDGERFRIGGLTFQAIDLPQNETLTTTLYLLPEQNSLFAGDIITNQSIPFLGDGNSGNWLKQLRMLRDRYPDVTVYPGHGQSGRLQPLADELIGYIDVLRSLVAKAIATNNDVTAQEPASILTEMETRYQNYQTSLVLPDLIEANIEGIAQELSQGS